MNGPCTPPDGTRTVFSRRQALTRGMAVSTMVAAGVAGLRPMEAVAGPHGDPYSIIGTNPGWPMRYRTSYQTSGGRTIGLHSTAPNQTFLFDPYFHSTCDSWANYFHSMSVQHFSSTIRLAWVGTAGVGGYKPGSNHHTGNAFDLTAMYYNNGGYIDCYFSHQSYAPVTHQRWYIGLAWSGRRFFPELGIVGTGGGHDNHIHLGRYKNNSSSILLSRTTWDTWLVQRTCKVMMLANIALDGQWGSQTESHYRTLMGRLGLSGYDPFTNASHLRTMADRIVARGLAGLTI